MFDSKVARLLLATLLGCLALPGAHAAQVMLSVPSSNAVEVGQTFDLVLKGKDFNAGSTGSNGGGVNLSWNPAVLRIAADSDIRLLYPDQSFGALTGRLNNAAGTLTGLGVGGTTTQAAFDIARITFTAVGVGTTRVTPTPGSTDAGQLAWTNGEGRMITPDFQVSQDVAVNAAGGSDTTPPVLTVPADLTRTANGTLTQVDLGTATANDPSEPVIIANNAPSAGFPLGTTQVTWTATDAAGNRATAVQSVTINPMVQPSGPKLHSGRLANVDANWRDVTLPHTYTRPVVIAVVHYPGESVPALARVRAAAGNRFQIRLQNPGGEALSGGYAVNYVVVEAGVYNEAEHGIKLEAATFNSRVTDHLDSWVGEARNYSNQYLAPVVLGQVMSANDARWSAFWSRGASELEPPSANRLYLGKHVGEDPARARANELIGYIVVESGSGVVGDMRYTAGLSADLVYGTESHPGSPAPPYRVGHALTAASSGVASLSAMDGENGGWAVLYGAQPLGGSGLQLAIEEDQVRDRETLHTSEQVAYLLFAPTTVSDSGPQAHRGRLTGVGDGWQWVNLPRSYQDPVVLATVQLDASLPPATVRIRNAAGNRFAVRVQNPGDAAVPDAYGVHYLVVEAGVYNVAQHGVKMEAVKYTSTLTDGNIAQWRGEPRVYQNQYSTPVVVGQVMSANDARWSVFWARGASHDQPPAADALHVGKNVAEDTAQQRADEVVGYLVVEQGSGNMSGMSYAAGVSADQIHGLGNKAPYQVSHNLSGAATAILSTAAIDGKNGGWPVLYGDTPLNNGQIDTAIAEDQIKDEEMRHTDEQVGYLVLP